MDTPIDNYTIYEQRWADWVDMKKYGPASRYLRWLIKRSLEDIERTSIKRVLDVGCGEGTTTQYLSSLLPGCFVRGIDFSKSGIELAKKAYGSEFIDFRCITVQNELEVYDMVTAFEVLEHIEDWMDFLVELAKHSRRFLFFSFPTGRMRPYEVNVGHYRNYKKGQMETAVKDLGFHPKVIRYAGFPFYSPIYREICQIFNMGNNSISTGKYGFLQKLISGILYRSFLLSSEKKWGDQFCGIFEKQ